MLNDAGKLVVWSALIGGLLALSGEVSSRAYRAPVKEAEGDGLGAQALRGSPNEAKIKQDLSYGNIPLYFVPNRGQVDESVRFYARTSGYTLWLTAQGLVFDRSLGADEPARHKRPWEAEEERISGESRREVHRLVFYGANPNPEIEGGDKTGHIVNYFIGSDPAKWRANIATSQAAVYREIYPNVDLKIYGREKQIEYDWVVRPGGDPEQIVFEYQGIAGSEIDDDNSLLVCTELGEFRHHKPYAYQEGVDGARQAVEMRFRKIGQDRYGFAAGKYDPTRPLIIDPVVLIYSTYLGGSELDFGFGVAVDASGCAYVTGRTSGNDFPVNNSFQPGNAGDDDAFITKIAADGRSLEYSTYLGGGNTEIGYAIAVDNVGCAVVTGYTGSYDFPLLSPLQSNYKSGDAFITKLSSDGTSLVFSTYLGGTLWEEARGVALDKYGCVYITGTTWSSDFPLLNPLQGNSGVDAFITKLSADGRSLVYSTYLGGTSSEGGGISSESGMGIVVDDYCFAYITGYTSSIDFPVWNAFQSSHQGYFDAFVTKLSPDGNKLIYSTYLGGEDYEDGSGIAIDKVGCAYVSGCTRSVDFPTHDAYQAENTLSLDVFVTKLSASGNTLIYSTYLGGNDRDRGWGIVVDDLGCAYITGETHSDDFPIINPFQPNHYVLDVFVSKFSPSGRSLIFSTYLGGDGLTRAFGLALDRNRRVYLTGYTDSTNFPTQNPYQAHNRGYDDAFITKLDQGYTVRTSVSGAGGSVSPDSQVIVSGEKAAINIRPGAGYAISSISDNGHSADVTNPYVIHEVREDHDVVVAFSRTYTVTAQVAGGHGSVSPATQTIVSGNVASINIYPDPGHHIGSITDNAVSVPTANPYVIGAVLEDHRVVVRFANDPPTVKITAPAAGAKVFDVVTVKAEARDDLRVLKVSFLIDGQLVGEDVFADSENIYTQAWDTRGYAPGTHSIRAVAYDEAGLTGADEISVAVENVALALQAQRLTERAWIIRRSFSRLVISIQKPGQVSVAKYAVYRKTGINDYQVVKEFTESEVSGQSYVWDDKGIDKEGRYTYRTMAVSGGGLILAVSNEVTI